jgi:hypothetical protein
MPKTPPPRSVRTLAGKLAEVAPMRRGSVSVRLVKCNKPGCPCRDDPKARHGPYASLVRGIGGKTVSRWIPADQVEALRQQVETGHRFRETVEAYWEACEQWADLELEASAASPSAEADEKGGSRRSSRRKSSERSPPS